MMSSASSLATKGNALFTPCENIKCQIAKDSEIQDENPKKMTEFDMSKISQ